MGRSGYVDDGEGWELIRWRGAVKSAFNGRRGQAFLQEMLDALDALPEKKLIAGELIGDGAYCALGAVGRLRGMELEKIDTYDRETVADEFGIAYAMACEIMYENDEWTSRSETPEQRFERVRRWVAGWIKDSPPQPTGLRKGGTSDEPC